MDAAVTTPPHMTIIKQIGTGFEILTFTIRQQRARAGEARLAEDVWNDAAEATSNKTTHGQAKKKFRTTVSKTAGKTRRELSAR